MNAPESGSRPRTAPRRPARPRAPEGSERPRRLQAALGRAGFALGARLPFGLSYRLGTALGSAVHALPGRNRAITRINLQLCFPELDGRARARIARASLIESARVVFEMGGIWDWPREKSLGLIREVVGGEHLQAALAAGRGVLMLTPHLGSWELGGLYLSSLAPTTTLYRPPRVRGLAEFYRERRERFGAHLVPADASGIRAVVKALRAGEVVGTLPDQDPGFGSGIFVPLFGVLANTSPLIPKLLQKTGATPLMGATLRLPGGRGFRAEIRPAPADIADPDLERAAAAMNRGIEELVRSAPEQYLWSYKRFKARPPGGARFYEGV